MQTYATPSTTDALVQHLRRVLVAGLEVDVQVVRNPRGGGEAAALSMALNADPALLFAGSGLTANSAIAAIGELRPLALVAQVPLVLVSFRNGDVPGVAELLQPGAPRSVANRHSGRAQRRAIAGRSSCGDTGCRDSAPVAYNGGNGALRGVLARQISLTLVPLPAALPYASNRKLRIADAGGRITTCLAADRADLCGSGISGRHCFGLARRFCIAIAASGHDHAVAIRAGSGAACAKTQGSPGRRWVTSQRLAMLRH